MRATLNRRTHTREASTMPEIGTSTPLRTVTTRIPVLAQVKGIGPSYQTPEEVDKLARDGILHEGAHVLGVFVRDRNGVIISRWFEVSEVGVGGIGSRM